MKTWIKTTQWHWERESKTVITTAENTAKNAKHAKDGEGKGAGTSNERTGERKEKIAQQAKKQSEEEMRTQQERTEIEKINKEQEKKKGEKKREKEKREDDKTRGRTATQHALPNAKEREEERREAEHREKMIESADGQYYNTLSPMQWNKRKRR